MDNFKRIKCGVCGEESAEKMKDDADVSFCSDCFESGKYINKLVEMYKERNGIPEDESMMVIMGEDGPESFVREKEIIEWCKRNGLDESEYLKPEYNKKIN